MKITRFSDPMMWLWDVMLFEYVLESESVLESGTPEWSNRWVKSQLAMYDANG